MQTSFFLSRAKNLPFDNAGIALVSAPSIWPLAEGLKSSSSAGASIISPLSVKIIRVLFAKVILPAGMRFELHFIFPVEDSMHLISVPVSCLPW